MRKRSSLKIGGFLVLAAVSCGDKGDQGAAGAAGEAGAPGAAGDQGMTGAAGGQGEQGTPGAEGAAGAAGEAGAQGASGEAGATGPAGTPGDAGPPGRTDPAAGFTTATRVKHLVVIFGENISFDHYFGTYPHAANDAGGAPFHAAAGTPSPNNLVTPLDPTHGFAPLDAGLLTGNPVAANATNGTSAVNPFLLTNGQAATADQKHNYMPEQQADNGGAMDLFPAFTGTAGPPPGTAGVPPLGTVAQVMGYYDGNTLGTLWSLAQNYAINDNSWSTNFGPSTPGALNLIAGQTNGMVNLNHTPLSSAHAVADGNGGWTMIGDTDPLGDVCSTAADQNQMSGKNVGDLLNAAHISWGWFMGGFDLTVTNPNGTTGCQRSSTGVAATTADYVPHHQPFQYYASTANPNHLRPSSVTAIGSTYEDDGATVDPANHQYDSHDFFDALHAGNFPAVSYLKAPAIQDAHPGYSDPIDEGAFVTQVVTAVQSSGDWESTAIVIAYDDSDGWYDHQAPPIVNPSFSVADALNGATTDAGAGLPGACNHGAQQVSATSDGGVPVTMLLGVPSADGGAVPVQGRCGYGTRQPLMFISPLGKKNYVDHTLTDQSSVLRFVEDNWLGSARIQLGGSFDTIAGTLANMLE